MPTVRLTRRTPRGERTAERPSDCARGCIAPESMPRTDAGRGARLTDTLRVCRQRVRTSSWIVLIRQSGAVPTIETRAFAEKSTRSGTASFLRILELIVPPNGCAQARAPSHVACSALFGPVAEDRGVDRLASPGFSSHVSRSSVASGNDLTATAARRAVKRTPHTPMSIASTRPSRNLGARSP